MKTYVMSREINVTLREDPGSAKIGPNIIMIYESILGCNMLGPDPYGFSLYIVPEAKRKYFLKLLRG